MASISELIFVFSLFYCYYTLSQVPKLIEISGFELRWTQKKMTWKKHSRRQYKKLLKLHRSIFSINQATEFIDWNLVLKKNFTFKLSVFMRFLWFIHLFTQLLVFLARPLEFFVKYLTQEFWKIIQAFWKAFHFINNAKMAELASSLEKSWKY